MKCVDFLNCFLPDGLFYELSSNAVEVPPRSNHSFLQIHLFHKQQVIPKYLPAHLNARHWGPTATSNPPNNQDLENSIIPVQHGET